MAHIKYYFQRDKNKYEQVWDYNEHLTWWVSFITNWFWFTDVTELTSNKRTCQQGLNLNFMFLSIAYVACLAFQNIQELGQFNYLYWANWSPYFIIGTLVIMPCFKLMFKFGFVNILISIVMFNLILGRLDWQIYSVLVFIFINLLGVQYNYRYLSKVKTYKGFELVKTQVNKYSLYYLYKKLTTVREV